MTDSRVRVGVVGVGSIGRHHARVLAALPDARFVGLFDTDRDRAERIAAEFGGTVSATLEELLANVDAVTVAVPTLAHAAVGERIGETDLNIFAAAVADFRPTDPSEDKLKRAEAGPEFQIGLTANPDIGAETQSLRQGGAVTVGFALETSDLVENARRKLDEKGFDLIVANDATDPLAGFDVDTNVATLVWREGDPEPLPTMTKHELAERILQSVAALLGAGG